MAKHKFHVQYTREDGSKTIVIGYTVHGATRAKASKTAMKKFNRIVEAHPQLESVETFDLSE